MSALSQRACAVFDLETTGTDVAKDRIVELGVSWHRPGEAPVRDATRINPGIPIPPEASKVHGITDAMVAGCHPFAAIAGHIPSWFAPPLLCVGFNVLAFDRLLLDAELERAGVAERMPAVILDVLVWVRWHHRGQRGRTLVEMAARYGVHPVDGVAHSAAVDAQMTGELLLAMVREGVIPDDVEAALAAQAEMAPKIDAERERYGYWLYPDRADGRLRLGAGKACGNLLEEADRDYLSFVLGKGYVKEEAAREAFLAAVRGGRA